MAGANESSYPTQASGLSFTQGFLLGQLSIVALIIFFIKFFIFGELPPADERALHLSSLRRARTLAHQRSSSHSLRRKASSVLRNPPAPPTAQSILAKTYYNVHGHQPESLDWFNVLVAQTIAQLRTDARQDDAVLSSLMQVMNGPGKPDWIGEIRITEIALGDEFPIFSNCRVIPVEEGGLGSSLDNGGSNEGRLQARMDVDLGDVITLGVETTLQLNYPKPLVAVLPVALAVSVVRFSGTLSLSFIPSSPDDEFDAEPALSTTPAPSPNPISQANTPPSRAPTTLAFTFLDDYRLDLSVRSLVGSRSRLQDVPKIAQVIESRIHAWFDERVVEPRFQQIVLPSLWPRKKTTRGGADEDIDGEEAVIDDDDDATTPIQGTPGGRRNTRDRRRSSALRKSRTGGFAASPAAKSGSLRSRHGVELDSFEARMEAEGERIREAEERAGVRPRTTATGALHHAHNAHRPKDIMAPPGDTDVRWRPRHERQDSEHWRIPGSMPEGP